MPGNSNEGTHTTSSSMLSSAAECGDEARDSFYENDDDDCDDDDDVMYTNNYDDDDDKNNSNNDYSRKNNDGNDDPCYHTNNTWGYPSESSTGNGDCNTTTAANNNTTCMNGLTSIASSTLMNNSDCENRYPVGANNGSGTMGDGTSTSISSNNSRYFALAMTYNCNYSMILSDAQRSDAGATVCSGSMVEDIEVESVLSQEDYNSNTALPNEKNQPPQQQPNQQQPPNQEQHVLLTAAALSCNDNNFVVEEYTTNTSATVNLLQQRQRQEQQLQQEQQQIQQQHPVNATAEIRRTDSPTNNDMGPPLSRALLLQKDANEIPLRMTADHNYDPSHHHHHSSHDDHSRHHNRNTHHHQYGCLLDGESIDLETRSNISRRDDDPAAIKSSGGIVGGDLIVRGDSKDDAVDVNDGGGGACLLHHRDETYNHSQIVGLVTKSYGPYRSSSYHRYDDDGDAGCGDDSDDCGGSLDAETHSIETKSFHSQDDAIPLINVSNTTTSSSNSNDNCYTNAKQQPQSFGSGSIHGTIKDNQHMMDDVTATIPDRTAATVQTHHHYRLPSNNDDRNSCVNNNFCAYNIDANHNSGRRSPGGTIYEGNGVRQHDGQYMHLALKRFHQSNCNSNDSSSSSNPTNGICHTNGGGSAVGSRSVDPITESSSKLEKVLRIDERRCSITSICYTDQNKPSNSSSNCTGITRSMTTNHNSTSKDKALDHADQHAYSNTNGWHSNNQHDHDGILSKRRSNAHDSNGCYDPRVAEEGNGNNRIPSASRRRSNPRRMHQYERNSRQENRTRSRSRSRSNSPSLMTSFSGDGKGGDTKSHHSESTF